jgi:hypothetical protein
VVCLHNLAEMNYSSHDAVDIGLSACAIPLARCSVSASAAATRCQQALCRSSSQCTVDQYRALESLVSGDHQRYDVCNTPLSLGKATLMICLRGICRQHVAVQRKDPI